MNSSMKQYFISHFKDFVHILAANILNTICQLYAIIQFYHAKHMDNLIKKVLIHPGVYIFINKLRLPVYVGVSMNLKQRLKNSHDDYQGEEILIIECPGDEKKAKYLEKALIAVFRPARNKEI